MASAFTEQEQIIIRKALKDAALEFAATLGMKKTTVEQLANKADISKGAFYKFYDTKESLFFEMLEDAHTEFYNAALEVLTTRTDLPASKRTAMAILRVCELLEEKSFMNFIEKDMPILMRKIPREQLQKHYHNDDIHIKGVIVESGLKLSVSPEVASAVIRGIMLTLLQREHLGEHYHTVLSIIVEGACEKIILN